MIPVLVPLRDDADLLDQRDGRLRRRVHRAEPAYRGDHRHCRPLVRTARQIDQDEPLDPRRLELRAGHGDGRAAGLADDRKRRCADGVRDGEHVARVVAPAVGAGAGHLAAAAAAQVHRHQLPCVAGEPFGEAVEAAQVRRQARHAHHRWRIRGTPPPHPEPPGLERDVAVLVSRGLLRHVSALLCVGPPEDSPAMSAERRPRRLVTTVGRGAAQLADDVPDATVARQLSVRPPRMRTLPSLSAPVASSRSRLPRFVPLSSRTWTCAWMTSTPASTARAAPSAPCSSTTVATSRCCGSTSPGAGTRPARCSAPASTAAAARCPTTPRTAGGRSTAPPPVPRSASTSSVTPTPPS